MTIQKKMTQERKPTEETKNAKDEKDVKDVKNTQTIITPKGRLSYPHLLERNSGGSYPSDKYETTFLIEKTKDISEIQDACMSALNAKFPGKFKSLSTLKHPPLRDGDDEEKYPGYWYLKAKTDYRPTIVGPNPKLTIDDPELIYGGQNARLSLGIFTYDKAGSKGVSLNLKNVQILGGGESFGGDSGNPQDQFSNEEESTDNENDHF